MDKATPQERAAHEARKKAAEAEWQRGMEIARKLAKGKEKPPASMDTTPLRVTGMMRREAKINELRDGLKDD